MLLAHELAAIIEGLRRNPLACSAPFDYRVITTEDGLRVSLHRVIYQRMRGGLEPLDYLLQVCDTTGCVNPMHYRQSDKPYIRRDRCRNGHVYVREDQQEDGSMRCHICAERRKRARRRGGDPNWVREARLQFCPQGHPYDAENTYIEITPAGRKKRHCRTCTIARAAGNDPADVSAA
jgi:hypothetical protein